MLRKAKIPISFTLIIGLIIGGISIGTASALVPGINSLVNYDSTNTAPSVNSGNQTARISEDGNVIAWSSSAHDVVAGDTSGSSRAIYVRNMQTGNTAIADVELTGTSSGDSDSTVFALSRTGRYVAFSASSTNIVSTPTVPASPLQFHVYLRDTLLNTTILVDQNASGVLANGVLHHPKAISVSDDGRFVLFESGATNLLPSNNPTSGTHIYMKDTLTGQVINPAVSNAGVRSNGAVSSSLASCDGSLIAFTANATNLTSQDNGQTNIYLADIRGGFNISNITYNANKSVILVSVSCNGRYVIMRSSATNITPDVVTGTNNHYFRYDRLTNEYVLIDKSSTGYISSTESAQTHSWGYSSIVSDDGKVVFFSNDKNMVAPAALNSAEVYLRNPKTNTTELVPINASGVERDGTFNTQALSISARGDYVVYNSYATNLIPGMTSGVKKLVLSKVE